MIADTHLPRGRRRLPEECLRRIATADLVIHAGDFSSVSAYEEIAAIGPRLAAVHGNVDEPALRERLPERELAVVEGVRIGVVHDAGPARGRLARMRRAFPGAEAVVFGHSHLPLLERDRDFQIFNPGSPTERRRASAHTMGTARVSERGIRFTLVRLS
ncbi:MAG TPA: metallophosphoesterase family protein [Solirubrobacterales bacterium]|nr:metallophosphoesterase family protein [Solirubrobacterales bacterium]